MKFLFVLDSSEYPLAPTPALARRVAGILAQRGHSVHLLELWDGKTAPAEEPGCISTQITFSDERVMNQILERGNPGGTPVALRLAKLCLHPTAAIAAVRQILFKKPRRISATKKAIEALGQAHSFDLIVSVAAPYASSFALEKAQVNAKKLSWQMDPYAGNQSYNAPGSWDREKELLAVLDGVFIAPAMTEYYADGAPLACFRNKMQIQDFPSLVCPQSCAKTREPGPLRCVFVGSLYPGLRTPHYALELFQALNASNVELILVGGGWENYPDDLTAPYQKTLGSRLTVTGPLPRSEAEAWLEKADILVNLGNGVANQVPSKLFEYFATGKPILHLAKLADDPCLGYLSRWPLSLVLQEDEGTGPEVCARLSEFLTQKGTHRLPFEQSAALFAENTPNCAADRLEKFCEVHPR